MSERHVPSAWSSCLTIAGLTWKRLSRGRALYVSFVIAVLPILFAVITKSLGEGQGAELFVIQILVAAVLAPMFVAASIGEEIEDRTTTYLWSRPLPRWTVLAGKLLALAPVAAIISLASWWASAQVAWSVTPAWQTFVALGAGSITISLVATGISTLGPRHGMALSICYMLFFDLFLGGMPATLRELSVSHQIRSMSGLFPSETDSTSAAIAFVLIAGVWSVVALLRIRRLEA